MQYEPKPEPRWTHVLDEWLRLAGYDPTPASEDDELRGIDRFATDDLGRRVGIEYRCDAEARETGHAFFVFFAKQPEWISTDADWIFYFVTPDEIYALRPEKISAELRQWRASASCRTRFVCKPATVGPGVGIRAGVAVPLSALAEASEYVALLSAGDGAVLQFREDADDG